MSFRCSKDIHIIEAPGFPCPICCSETKIKDLHSQLAHEKKWREHYERIANLPHTEKMANLEKQLSEKSREVEELQKIKKLCQQDYDNIALEMTTFLGREFKSHATDAVLILLDRIKETQSRLAAAEEALRIGIKWMEWWLEMGGCECESWHVCGRTEREKELSEMRKALSPLPKPNEHEGAHGGKNHIGAANEMVNTDGYIFCPFCEIRLVETVSGHNLKCLDCCRLWIMEKEAKGGSEEEIIDEVERTIIPAKDPDEGLDEELRLLREMEKRLREFAAEQSYPKILEIEDICGKLDALRAGDEGGK